MNTKLFPASIVARIRQPDWKSPWGWSLEASPASGRATCRCCGKRIAKGDTGLSVYLDIAQLDLDKKSGWHSVLIDGNSYHQTKVWFHADCVPVMP